MKPHSTVNQLYSNKNLRRKKNQDNQQRIVKSLSCVRLLTTPQTIARQAPLSCTTSQSLLKFISSELVMPSNHLILCHSLLLLQQTIRNKKKKKVTPSIKADKTPSQTTTM